MADTRQPPEMATSQPRNLSTAMRRGLTRPKGLCRCDKLMLLTWGDGPELAGWAQGSRKDNRVRVILLPAVTTRVPANPAIVSPGGCVFLVARTFKSYPLDNFLVRNSSHSARRQIPRTDPSYSWGLVPLD